MKILKIKKDKLRKATLHTDQGGELVAAAHTTGFHSFKPNSQDLHIKYKLDRCHATTSKMNNFKLV